MERKHPFIDKIQGYISKLQPEKEDAKLERKELE
jgi:hypothetical protein